MELFELLQMSPVQGPRLASIEEAGEDNSPVHLELCGQLDGMLVQDTNSKTTESLAGLTDPGVDLFIQAAVIADGTTKVFHEVIHRLQLGALDGDKARMGGGGRRWLK